MKKKERKKKKRNKTTETTMKNEMNDIRIRFFCGGKIEYFEED